MNSFEKRPIEAYQPKIDERDGLTEKTPNLFDKPTESCIKNVSGSPPSESSFFLLCRRCAVKDGCLSGARRRNGGVYTALAGNLSRGGNIHMTEAILTALGALGSIASIVSLVLYLHDKK